MVRRVHAKKRDANEPEITRALRGVGATVVMLDGRAGLPDLLVGHRGVTYLMEVKQDGTARVKQNDRDGRDGLDVDQHVFFESWTGGPCVAVRSVDEAINVVLGRAGKGWK